MSNRGLRALLRHLGNVYGERWPGLLQALVKPPRQVARLNGALFAQLPEDKRDLDTVLRIARTIIHPKAEWEPGIPGCVRFPLDATPVRPFAMRPDKGEQELLSCYLMDPASVFAARLLPPFARNTLDMCSAPGGKGLLLAERAVLGMAIPWESQEETLETAFPRIILNERSSARRARLRHLLDEWFPPEVLQHVSVTGRDASRWIITRPSERYTYDSVLVDVPCSTERHLLRAAPLDELVEACASEGFPLPDDLVDELAEARRRGASKSLGGEEGSTGRTRSRKELEASQRRNLADWSPARSEHLVQQQKVLLRSAKRTIPFGGRIVYATCALDPQENDAVVSEVVEHSEGRFAVVPAEECVAEWWTGAAGAPWDWSKLRTEIGGLHFLPDVAPFAGPLYCCVLQRCEPDEEEGQERVWGEEKDEENFADEDEEQWGDEDEEEEEEEDEGWWDEEVPFKRKK